MNDRAAYDALRKTGKYLHCALCVAENKKTTTDVIVVEDGGLLIWCRRHDEAVTFLNNGSVAKFLKESYEAPCSHCAAGHEHSH